MPTPDETSSPMSTHLALALTRYVRQLRKDGLPVPLVLDELAAFLTLYVKSYQAAPGVVGDVDMSHDVLMVRRLLITKPASVGEQSLPDMRPPVGHSPRRLSDPLYGIAVMSSRAETAIKQL